MRRLREFLLPGGLGGLGAPCGHAARSREMYTAHFSNDHAVTFVTKAIFRAGLHGRPSFFTPRLFPRGFSFRLCARAKIQPAQLTPRDAPATPTCAPVPAHRKSEAGTRTPSTPPQTIVPRPAPEDSESSPPKPVAGSVRQPYRRPSAELPYSSQAAAPQPDTAPRPLHLCRRPPLGCAAG